METWVFEHRVPRPRLVERLRDSRLAVVEAGAGYGKSTLLAEASAALPLTVAIVPLDAGDGDDALLPLRLARSLRRAGLSDVAAAMQEAPDPRAALEALADALDDRREPVILAIDDAHHLDDRAAPLLRRLVGELPRQHGLWLVARRLAPAVAAVVDDARVTRLDASDLRFTGEEARALCLSVLGIEGPAEALVRTTDGWVSALVLGALAAARGADGA
ncbi:MAG: hypothetical protein FJW96_09100, partial [Actinobacteria bacterium]|nr:hypothetical protein [Actinomycetota bacterium]